MILQVLHCPHCHGTDIVRHGQTRQGKQRYRCREQRCAGRTFLLDYSYPGQSPEVKQQIVDMAMNASGIRDTARVLHVSTNTVMTELKKKESTLQHVNQPLLQGLHLEQEGPGALEAGHHHRPRRVLGPLGQEEAGWVRDLGEAQLAHLEDADLVGRSETVLDGDLDPFIRAYQKANNLPVTGRLDDELLTKLRTA